MKCLLESGMLVMLVTLAVAGCGRQQVGCDCEEGYVCLKIDPRSSRVVAAALWPQLEAMNRQRMELVAQHRWLRESLDKSIRILEEEKGLERIPLTAKMPFGAEAPASITEPPQTEPLYVPYSAPDANSSGEAPSLNIMRALLNLEILGVNSYMAGANDWVENFEQRLQRLEQYYKQ